VAEVVEHLLNKHKALSSAPNTPKKEIKPIPTDMTKIPRTMRDYYEQL
jgi:hypothetical protein